LVVQEHTWSPKAGKYVALLGSYNPADKENKLSFDKAELEKFLKNGATPSDTVARLLKKAGVSGLDKFIKTYVKRRSKSAPPEEKPAPPVKKEKPAEEVKPVAEEKKEEAAPEVKPAEPVVEEKKEEPKEETPAA
jgi:small subunit ribosomal protein S16